MCSQGLLSKAWNICHVFREVLIEIPGSGGATNKLEMCKLEMNTDAIWYATTSSFLKMIVCLNVKEHFSSTQEATLCCDIPQQKKQNYI